MSSHRVLKQVAILPLHEDATVQMDTEREEIPMRDGGNLCAPPGIKMHVVRFSSRDCRVTFELGPSARLKRLLDAGFSEKKAVKILDVLGEK